MNDNKDLFNEKKKENIKRYNYKKIICIILVIILIIVVLFLIYLFKNNIITFNINNNNSTTPKVELNHTEVNTKIQEGIYITDVSEVVENTMPSIVSITSKTLIQLGRFGPNYYGYGQEQYSEGAGSGIIISQTDEEILILTNNHVVDGTSELSVQFINNKTVDATIKGTSERKDVAVISVKVKDIDDETSKLIKIATIGNSDDLKVGNGIIAIGNALGYGQSVTTGVISALNRTVSGDTYNNKMIQIDAAINGGNSGGALLNSKGEVVGINSAKYSSNSSLSSASIEGMGFAIPISDVEDLINNLMSGESDTNGMTLGIEGYMTNSGYMNGYNLPSGFYISKIVSGSNADKSELEIGNIIIEIDGNKINSINDISDVLYEKRSGNSVILKILYINSREYKEKEIKINLEN
ncbi:MAG: trypsin-like peptidase domain-containing protein [Clostridium sp.]|nr:trypsin-like peptidase domain-containing protein [Clostridium sp.]MCM1443709.1 trypsin-like peptidase domain-containing protein [Candidatus Amulumruptor caecigallinarius]